MSVEHTLHDADARRIIEEDLEHTLLVEAGAGTGKTTGLVRRMTALVAGGVAAIGEIAAMTFTTRAAGQLRERFEDELRQQLHSCSTGDTSANLRRALDDIDVLSIGTIHSFCAQILAEYPVEAGIEPGFTVLDADEDAGLREQHIIPLRRRLLAFRYPAVLNLLHHAVEAYDTERQRSAMLNHNDLLIRTRDMLRDNGALRRELQQRFPFVLVDEFQDTDPMQAEIIVFLAGEQHDESDWRRMRLRPGALFAVGDPKQSIYRFRRADIGVYNTVRRLVRESGGHVLQLGSSFRAVPALCTWINDSFSSVFPPEADDVQAADVPLHPTRMDGGTLCGSYRIDIETGNARTREDIAEAEAAVLANWISRAIGILRIVNADTENSEERLLRADDILVLFREHQDLRIAAGVFESAGIPHQLESGRIQREAPALADFLNALLALIDPEDPVPIVGFLRGPFCGADDAALARYAEDGGVFAFNARAVKGADPRIREGLQYIKDSVRLVRSNPPSTVIADMIDRLALLPWAASRPKGWSAAAAFQELLHIAQRRSARGDALADIVLHLQQAVKNGTMRTSQLRTEPEAVRLMTLHSAKGLEAPVVILAAAAGVKRHDVSMVVDRRSDPPSGSLRLERVHGAYKRMEIARPADWEHHEALERAHIDAELVRLQYVAATRARCACIVSVPDATARNRHPMWGVLTAHLERIPPQPGSTPAARSHDTPVDTDIDAVRRRITESWDITATPTYARMQPSMLHGELPSAQIPSQSAVRGDMPEGKGMAFGSAMHTLLEHMLLHPDADAAAVTSLLTEEHELDGSTATALLTLLDRTRRHPLWTRITTSDEHYTEVPFGLPPRPSPDGLPGVMEGTIDLVFRDDDGWTIIDYKTDAVNGDIDALSAYYAPQLRACASAWKEITGEETRTLLWFLSAEEAVVVT